MRGRGYVGKVRVKVKPRGSVSALERDELRSEVMKSLGDEGWGPAKSGGRGEYIGKPAGMAEVKGQGREGKG